MFSQIGRAVGKHVMAEWSRLDLLNFKTDFEPWDPGLKSDLTSNKMAGSRIP